MDNDNAVLSNVFKTLPIAMSLLSILYDMAYEHIRYSSTSVHVCVCSLTGMPLS